MASDRMFRVIVLGGVALVGPAGCAMVVAPDGGVDAAREAFPSELPVQVDAAPRPDAFPSELPPPPDSAPAADATSSDADASCFPHETAFSPDC